MADTLPNIKIPAGIWTDLYDASGIDVGAQILIQNIGVCDLSLNAQAAPPTDENSIQLLERADFSINDAGDAGAWAFCLSMDGKVNVRLP